MAQTPARKEHPWSVKLSKGDMIGKMAVHVNQLPLTSAGTDINSVLELLVLKRGSIQLSIKHHDHGRVHDIQQLICLSIIRAPKQCA